LEGASFFSKSLDFETAVDYYRQKQKTINIMDIFSFVIITSLVFIALINFGLPVYFNAIKDAEVEEFIASSSSRNTILSSIVLPLCIGLSFAYMAAEIAACGGWINSRMILGFFAGILFCIMLIRVIPSLIKCRSKVVISAALLVSFLIALSSIFLMVGLNSWDSIDHYHHPIYKAVDMQWVNMIITFLGKTFPMEDYPIIHIETRVYSPEHSFLQTFTLVSEMTYTVVIITSLYAIVKDSVKKTENQ
jgi:hypothetical protein